MVREPPSAEQPIHVQLLLAVRQKHGWSQEQLGRVLLVSRWTIMRWEAGEKDPPVFIKAALLELLA